MLTIDITRAPVERIAFAAWPPAALASMPHVPALHLATRSWTGLAGLERGRQVSHAIDVTAFLR
ncbi:hypothetical protein ABT297_22455 [Dactylosporangium sp. NPDC000555]|uniref:hypothetical protein n=1 Tax=Dactylosporangium sp. NPDC000555 TaxID=3154260 RepID=UPI00332BEB74